MASIKFLENISFDDDIEIQFGDPTTPEGVIKANNSGLFLKAPAVNTLILLECSSSGFIAFGYGGSNYFFFMNSISGATEIRFGNVKKFETLSTGVKVTGDIDITGDIDVTGDILGSNTTLVYVRQIKLDTSTAVSAGGNGRGSRVLVFGSQALAAGRVYALTSGGWVNANATQVDLLSTGLLGVATTGTSGDPLLMDGVIYLNADPGGNIGDVIYLDTTAGALTNDVSGFVAGNVVRVVGHKVGTNKVYFNPSRDWIEIS